jgi:hypothetical protein
MGKYDDYEQVKSRKKRFLTAYPDGRIVVQNVSHEPLEYAHFWAKVYKNAEEQKDNLPLSSGYGFEVRDKEKSVSRQGKEYESVNYTSWTENAEESAVGRALDNAGYASKCSREEMEKVDRMSKTLSQSPTPDKAPSPSPKPEETVAKVFGGEVVGDVKLEDVVKLVNQLPNAEMVDWMHKATAAKADGTLAEVYEQLKEKVNG